MKKVLAVLLAVILLSVPFSGCYKSADVLTIDGYAIYPGLYLYFQLQAISEAGVKLNYLYSGKEIFDQTIDGVPARDWINNRTIEYAKEFAFVDSEYNRLDLDEESLAREMGYYEYTLRSEWQQTNYFYSRNGIGYETYSKVFEFNLKSNQVFNTLFVEEGGELETPEDEIKEYFIDNYTYLDYLRLPKTDDEQNALDTAELSDLRGEAISMLLEAREAAGEADSIYVDSVNTGLQAAFELYLETNDIPEDETDDERNKIVAEDVVVRSDNTSFEGNFIDNLFKAPYDSFEFLETELYFYIFCRRSMLDDDPDSWKDYKTSIVTELSADTFLDYVAEKSLLLSYSENKGARRYFSLNKAYFV